MDEDTSSSQTSGNDQQTQTGQTQVQPAVVTPANEPRSNTNTFNDQKSLERDTSEKT